MEEFIECEIPAKIIRSYYARVVAALRPGKALLCKSTPQECRRVSNRLRSAATATNKKVHCQICDEGVKVWLNEEKNGHIE